jgi:hypothetical protein
MTASFHDILAVICTDVKPLNENDLQLSLSLSTVKEAQLAYDVLAAHGFDVRVYHENGTSRLYINRSVAPSEEKLDAALAHAHTLRHILDTMEDIESTDYQISFTNNLNMGKQISIYFPSREQPARTPITEVVRPTAAAVSVRPATAYSPAADNRNRRLRKKSAFMASGPALAKKTMFNTNKGLRGWLHNYFVSHVAESFLAFCGMFFLAVFTLSVLITSRAYLCPDLAVVESRAWYCHISLIPRNNEKK